MNFTTNVTCVVPTNKPCCPHRCVGHYTLRNDAAHMLLAASQTWGCGLFLLSCGCDSSGDYCVAHEGGLIPNETQFPCRTPAACLQPTLTARPPIGVHTRRCARRKGGHRGAPGEHVRPTASLGSGHRHTPVHMQLLLERLDGGGGARQRRAPRGGQGALAGPAEHGHTVGALEVQREGHGAVPGPHDGAVGAAREQRQYGVQHAPEPVDRGGRSRASCRASFERGGGRGGGGFGPKTWCTKNGLTRFSRLYISFFPAMVTLVWGGGEGVLGEGSPPPLLGFNYSKEALALMGGYGEGVRGGLATGAASGRRTHFWRNANSHSQAYDPQKTDEHFVRPWEHREHRAAGTRAVRGSRTHKTRHTRTTHTSGRHNKSPRTIQPQNCT